MRDTERQRYRQKEKQAPCGKPDVELDPRTPGSPEPKADAQPVSHPDAPIPTPFYLWPPIQSCHCSSNKYSELINSLGQYA